MFCFSSLTGAAFGRPRPLTHLALLLGLAHAGHVQAQMNVTARNPVRNARNAPAATNVDLTFSQALNAATAGNARVFSAQRGGQLVRGGNATASGNVLTVNPATDLKPGETVFVTVPTTVASGGGTAATKQVHQFTAAAGGTGVGKFVAPAATPEVTVGTSPFSVAVGDVDNDGDLDMLTANFTGGAGSVSVRLNNGSGGYSGGSEVATGAASATVVLGDWDNDGDLDLATANRDANTVSVRFNDGAGTFSGGSEVSVATNPFGVVAGDLDGDGDLDLAVAGNLNGQVSIRLNNGSGTFSNSATLSFSSFTPYVALGDLDNDGDLDIIQGRSSASTVRVWLNSGNGTSYAGFTVTVGSGPFEVALGDVDNDGDLDMLAARNIASGVVAVRLNNGSGAFAGGSNVSVGANPIGLTLGDVDADGDLDFITGNSSATGGMSLRLNDGAGTFTAPAANAEIAAGGATTRGVTLGDVDGDGDLDLLAANPGSNNVSVRLNQANDLTISTPQSVPGGTYNNITIENGGNGLMTGDIIVNGTLLIKAGGYLQTRNTGGLCQTVSGPGNFVVAARGELRSCSPDGISASGPTGNIQVTGTRTFSPHAIYSYDGTLNQITGSGLPSSAFVLSKFDVTTLSLTNPVAVRGAVFIEAAGNINTNGQVLTLRSDADSTAFVINNSTGLVQGNVTVQRYVGGPTAGGYRHLSSPVQAATVSDLTTAGFTPVVNPAYNALPYVALPAASFPNIYGFDETRGGTNPAFADFLTGYFSPATLGATLAPGRGYSVFMPGAQTPDFVGALTNGDVPVNLTVTGTNSSPNQQKAGWHLLGNLYPQPIDWDLATIPSGMSGSISVFRTQGGNNGLYLTRQNGLGSLPNGELPLGQGFFARATTDNTVFTFTNALRVGANPGPVARPVADARPRLTLTLAATTPDAVADEVTIYAQAGATPGEDLRFDGLRPGRNLGNVPTIASLIEGQEAAVNGLPLETLTAGTTTIELTAALPVAGTYTLAVGELANFGSATVELLDRLTNTRYDLRQQATVTLTAAQANTVQTGRWAVVFNGQRVLGTSHLAPRTSHLTLFPNPAAGGASVRLTGAWVGSSVTVFDATGRAVVRTLTDATGTATVPTQGLAAGVYVLKAGAQTTRLVVE